MSGKLTTYSELAAIVEQLPLIVASTRRSLGLSQHTLAATLQVSCSTISRIESGEAMSTDTLCTVLRWLDRRAS